MTVDEAWIAAAYALQVTSYFAALLGPGGAWFLLAFPTTSHPVRAQVASTVLVIASIGLVAAALVLPVTAGHLSGGGIAGMLDRELIAILAFSPTGAGAAMAVIGWLLVMGVAVRAPAAIRVAAVGGLLVVASLTAAGHASAEDPVAGRLLLGVHLAGAAYWLGALWPLWLVARHMRGEAAAWILERFGTMALVLVGGLVVAGLLLTLMLVDSVSAMWQTRYGLMLLAKLMLVAALLALAAMNRFRFVPRLAAGEPGAARALQHTIAAEMVVGSLIVLTTAALTTYASPFG